MKKFWQNAQWVIILTAVWIVLVEEFSAQSLACGAAAGIFSLLFSGKYLLGEPLRQRFPLNLFWLFQYGFFLLVQIYKAGFITIRLILSGSIKPGIIEIETRLRHDYQISMLANSITLTPGTVTIDRQGRKLTVLWLNMETDDPQLAAELIVGKLEKRFPAAEIGIEPSDGQSLEKE